MLKKFLRSMLRKFPALRKLLSPLWIYYERKKYSIRRKKFLTRMSFTEASNRFPVRNELHAYMHHYFLHLAPVPLREHRNYFSRNNRGFGEDAFHGMWYTILQEFKPELVLEIGVYRGQVVTLWGLIAKLLDFKCRVNGVSPFSPTGDQVSVYLDSLDYLQDTLSSNKKFGLEEPYFMKAYSTDMEAVNFIKSRKWNLIYIDGNHDYEVALADYEICRDSLADGGLLVMDDSSLYTNFQPPSFSFKGHPGPSRVVQELAMKELHFLGGVGHNNIFIKS